ncbi:methylcrotonoyl-CoA carboxylase subunit alpha mitochondrial precursor [Lophiotrema nucula]|uniref:Methylcrotonoyl-CoA carboxylase subunit alpha mitochondrial n=1 Tax=Lophiotrema nucula TaxID=690887 RepID=A0A6A5Z3Z9_9PLEO|nr:methylcrotonoyl-CoA carboxylase subunit alpha mitochondrial precursor [Lophiotrema nucula]
MRAIHRSKHLSRKLLNASPHTRRSSTVAASSTKPLTSVLIANRGEIALRVGRTASEFGIRTTTLYTDPDARSQHALSSPFAVNLGEPSAYLDGDRIIQIAKEQGCQGIHPGYGFLSENPTFARKCTEAGLTFIGPPWKAIEAMGSKSESKDIMIAAGVPCIPGYHGSNQDPEHLKDEAAKIGYPVLLKAVKGGGGKGMRIVNRPEEFFDQLNSAKSEARNSFGDEVMLVEKYITTPRHIEVQVFADSHGNCVALGERDCSIQRRHQKILEESPAPHLKEEIRQDIWEKARAAALAVKYEGAGTVEFIFDNDTGEFFFMEMNTRLQVEHPVTEMVTGEDLVRWQLIVAEGGKLPLTQQEIEQRIAERGAAIEARIYAENPDMNFIPDSGLLLHLKKPTPSDTVRIDAGFVAGDEVSSHYDPMIAKLIVQGPTREAAIQKLRAALEEYEVAGPITNIEFLKKICVSPDFIAGDVETGYIQKHHDELFTPEPPAPEIYAQAALGLALQEIAASNGDPFASPPVTAAGFGTGYQQRGYNIVEIPADGKSTGSSTAVQIRQTGPSTFDATVDGNTYPSVTASFSPSSNTITAFYPHTRLASTFIRDGDRLTLFTQGKQHRLQLSLPKWAEKALGVKDVTNSVLAPMPCKVLRVEVKGGDEVGKDQPLVVIESMKMETVIRSPHDGVIGRVVHGVGDIVKAGTALVEFRDEAEK